MRAYYWCGDHNDIHNWGDSLSPILLDHFAGITAEWSTPPDAQIVSTGSVLDVIPDGWHGIVAGSGKLKRETQTDLTNAKVLGLRGPLTAHDVRYTGTPVLGDPALLASELTHVTPNLYDLGIIPHWNDPTLCDRFAYLGEQYNVVNIDPKADPLEVISTIGSCRKIVSSSLHGLIVADAFGIPRRAEKPPGMGSVCVCGNMHEGDSFKFEDHNATVGLPMEWHNVQTADQAVVEKIQYDLFNMFTELSRYVSA